MLHPWAGHGRDVHSPGTAGMGADALILQETMARGSLGPPQKGSKGVLVCPHHLGRSGVQHPMAPGGKWHREATPLFMPHHPLGAWSRDPSAPNRSQDLSVCPLCAHSPKATPTAPPGQSPALSRTAHPSSSTPFGAGGGGLCVPLRRGDGLPTPAAPQPHTLPYNALFMRSGRPSSEMPLQSRAVPVPAVPLAMRVLSQHGTASLPAPARAMPAMPPAPGALPRGKHGTGKSLRAAQQSLSASPGIRVLVSFPWH